jgi:hypothetical protein
MPSPLASTSIFGGPPACAPLAGLTHGRPFASNVIMMSDSRFVSGTTRSTLNPGSAVN